MTGYAPFARIRRAPIARAATRSCPSPATPTILERNADTLDRAGARAAFRLSPHGLRHDRRRRSRHSRDARSASSSSRDSTCGRRRTASSRWRPCSADSRRRVILLDLMMPVMNGWQFREAQARIPKLRRDPRRRGDRRGRRASDIPAIRRTRWLSKPVDFDRLLATIGASVVPNGGSVPAAALPLRRTRVGRGRSSACPASAQHADCRASMP